MGPQKEMFFILMIQRTGFGNGDASELREVLQETAVTAMVNDESSTEERHWRSAVFCRLDAFVQWV